MKTKIIKHVRPVEKIKTQYMYLTCLGAIILRGPQVSKRRSAGKKLFSLCNFGMQMKIEWTCHGALHTKIIDRLKKEKGRGKIKSKNRLGRKF